MLHQGYLYTAFIVFFINAMPAFMPPTWSILAFFHLKNNLEIIPLVLIGASCATLGRIVLYYLSYHFSKIFPKRTKNNFAYLGKYFNSHKHISIPLFLLYGFSPIPSNQLFIIAGFSKWDIFSLGVAFFSMRIVTYSLWLGTVKILSQSLIDIFGNHFSKHNGLVFDFFGILIIFIVSVIKWEKVLKIGKK